MVTAGDTIGHDKTLQDHWIKRLVALIIDAVIFYAIAWVILFFIPWGWGGWYWLGWSFISGVLFFLYATIMEMTSGATIGKGILNLKVTSLNGPVNAEKALIRNISKIHGLFLLLDWLLGFLTEGDPKQKYMDRVAGTTVISTEYQTMQQQHIYQSPPYQDTQPAHQEYPNQQQPVYEYRGQPEQYQAPPQQYPQQQAAVEPAQQQAPQQVEHKCDACGASQILTGDGRYQCIRCGKIT